MLKIFYRELTRESYLTFAEASSQKILAVSAIKARVGQTLVDFALTMRAFT
jgi:hypothetical protein